MPVYSRCRLNAYVNKVFAQAKQFYEEMDVSPICTSVAWLTTQQDPDGSFRTGGRVIHREMHVSRSILAHISFK